MINMKWLLFILVLATVFTSGCVAPNVAVDYKPLIPYSDHRGLLNATADDNVMVSKINIYLDDEIIKTCFVDAIAGNCLYENKFSEGNHTYYAVAFDSSDNMGRNPDTGTKTFFIG
jgi:hypothetical protein